MQGYRGIQGRVLKLLGQRMSKKNWNGVLGLFETVWKQLVKLTDFSTNQPFLDALLATHLVSHLDREDYGADD